MFRQDSSCLVSPQTDLRYSRLVSKMGAYRIQVFEIDLGGQLRSSPDPNEGFSLSSLHHIPILFRMNFLYFAPFFFPSHVLLQFSVPILISSLLITLLVLC